MSELLDAGLPRAVAIAWGMVADPQRGPKRELSHERIVEAAVAIADADGLGAVTMGKVASSLGFTTMALYRYVTSKDDLLMLMQESVLSLTPPDRTLGDAKLPPEPLGWRTEVAELAGALRGVYRDHPWLTEIPVSHAQLLTPNNLAVVDHALRAMRELSMSEEDKTGLLVVLTTYVRANAMMQRDFSRQPDQLTASATAFLSEVVTAERYPYLYPLVESGAYLGDLEEAEEESVDYDYGLKVILDGIAAYADRCRTDGAAAAAGDADAGAEEPSAAGAAAPLDLDHVRRDAKVRDAIGRRKEAEGKLREARKREQEMIKRALDRGPKP